MFIDMPSRADVERLAAARDPHSVTIYVPTSTVTDDTDANRLAARAGVDAALDRLRDADAPRNVVTSITEQLDELLDDAEFWRDMGRSLAIFVTPGSIVEFRLANALEAHVSVSDRFAIAPILRAVAFPNSALVLALSQNDARLVEVSADQPARRVDVSDLPGDAASAIGLASLGGRSPYGRIQGGEGRKVRLTQYARLVDHALRPVLNARSLPLIVAAAEPLASIYRNLAGYAQLADEGIDGNPDELSEAQLADAARGILDRIHADELAALRETFVERRASGRAATDLSDLARAAAFGAISTLAVDMDAEVPGTVGEDGALTLGDDSGHDVLEEIARLALDSGARVISVRREDMPEDAQAAGILRFAV